MSRDRSLRPPPIGGKPLSTAAVFPLPRPPPVDPLLDASSCLRVAVEGMCCATPSLRWRVARALGHVGLVEQQRARLPADLVAALDRIRAWVGTDSTLRTLHISEVDYIASGIVDAFHIAVKLHAAPSTTGEVVVH